MVDKVVFSGFLPPEVEEKSWQQSCVTVGGSTAFNLLSGNDIFEVVDTTALRMWVCLTPCISKVSLLGHVLTTAGEASKWTLSF